MSSWTEVLLTASIIENVGPEDGPTEYPAVASLNLWLTDNNWGPLFEILPPRQEMHRPNSCFAGNFKGLDCNGFVGAVERAPWRWARQVQLFLRKEDDRGFIEEKLSIRLHQR